MNLKKHLHAQLERQIVESRQPSRIEDIRHEQNRVRPERARLADLVFLDNKIFSQHRLGNLTPDL